MNITLNSSILFCLRVVKSFASIIILIITAKFFGAGSKMDSWVAVSTFSTAVAGIVFGSINEIFRTRFITVFERKNENSALNEVYSLLFYTGIFCIFLFIICLFGKEYIFNLFFTNNSTYTYVGKELFYNLLFLFVPLIFINQVNGVLVGVLNAYDLFFIPEIVSIFTTILSIAIIFFLVTKIDIYSIIVSQYFASFILFFILLFFLRKKGIKFYKNNYSPKFKDVKVYLYISAPLLLPYLIGQVNAVTEKRFMSVYGKGYLSYINYSKQIIGVLQPVIFGVLMTIMVPQLTKFFVKKDLSNYKKYSTEYFDICIIICICLIPILYGGQNFICMLFFNHGKISNEALYLITKLFGYYGLSFIAIIFYCYIGALYLTINKAKVYSYVGVFTQILILLLNYLLYNKFSVEIFPIIFGASHLISAMLLVILLDKNYCDRLVYKFVTTFFITAFLAILVKVLNDYFKYINIVFVIGINFLIFCGLILASIFFTNNQILKRYLKKNI